MCPRQNKYSRGHIISQNTVQPEVAVATGLSPSNCIWKMKASLISARCSRAWRQVRVPSAQAEPRHATKAPTRQRSLCRQGCQVAVLVSGASNRKLSSCIDGRTAAQSRNAFPETRPAARPPNKVRPQSLLIRSFPTTSHIVGGRNEHHGPPRMWDIH